MDVRTVLDLLAGNPHVATLPFRTVLTFCDLTRWLRDEIAVLQPSYVETPPLALPINLHNFLVAALAIQDQDCRLLWTLLRRYIWTTLSHASEIEDRNGFLIDLFLRHGGPYGIRVYNLRPPVRTCLDPDCVYEVPMEPGVFRARELGHPDSHDATLFTRQFGALPVRTTSLYCRYCKTRYHANYYVHERASVRTYYGDVPRQLQIATHYFIEADLCELFTNMMAFSWTSATNCARIYNLSTPHRVVHRWSSQLQLDVDNVWDAFFLYALLRDCKTRNTNLEIPNDAKHADRYLAAIQDRNAAMVGPKNPYWNHACNLCCWISEDESGEEVAVRSCVTDGLSIGHPCCAVHDCPNPIMMKKGARYCRDHQAREDDCSVLSCKSKTTPGFRTCAEPSHRALEDYLRLEHKAMFQLRRRLERLDSGSKTTDSIPTTSISHPQLERLISKATTTPVPSNGEVDNQAFFESLDQVLDNGEIECEAEKSASGNKRHRAQFGRRRTHNEELVVASCGIIIGRATFFGSEAINGVVWMWKILFPTLASVPQVLWHDQNCRVWRMLQNEDEETRAHFAQCALPVDVFHFKCKHKESDIVCGTHCNPYQWPELRTEEGEWRFNSSAAEQTNVWMGKFQPIVREMQVDRYNFFLDEVSKRRNDFIAAELEHHGHAPYFIPREALE
ncbi:hypothetical protein LXA43DRAFT_1100746 [Ganoderma leucocontextum]|nr:hypothetical protein LXA43DRAFT_1100746 [Ganoderma leucocontextum]